MFNEGYLIIVKLLCIKPCFSSLIDIIKIVSELFNNRCFLIFLIKYLQNNEELKMPKIGSPLNLI